MSNAGIPFLMFRSHVKTQGYKNTVTANLPQRKSEKKRNDTTAGQMAKKIGVSEKTYRAMKTVIQKGIYALCAFTF